MTIYMVIIDMNTLAHVFNPSDSLHAEFKPLIDFIMSRKNILAWGGTTYNEELKKCPKYYDFFIELGKKRISKKFPNEPIDAEETRIYRIVSKNDFNDGHIIALQIISKAKIVCSVDKSSYRFIKDQIKGVKLYPKRHRKPSIYSQKSNQDLLSRL